MRTDAKEEFVKHRSPAILLLALVELTPTGASGPAVLGSLTPGANYRALVAAVAAGTSGRLGVLDAAECPPTYSTPPALARARAPWPPATTPTC